MAAPVRRTFSLQRTSDEYSGGGVIWPLAVFSSLAVTVYYKNKEHLQENGYRRNLHETYIYTVFCDNAIKFARWQHPAMERGASILYVDNLFLYGCSSEILAPNNLRILRHRFYKIM